MILLWGVRSDDPISAVYSALRSLGYYDDNNSDKTLFFFDQQDDLLNANIELFVDSKVEGKIEIENGNKNVYKQIDLANVTSAYLRPYDWRHLPEIENTNNNSEHWQHASFVEDTTLLWSELTSAFVINRPSPSTSNSSKPYQAMQIQSSTAAGFDIPDTLITTDPEAAIEFWKYHGTVIYKSISGVRSIVSRLTSEDLKDRINDISWCPTQFQEYVHGNDYRVHVVGEEDVFACKIITKADDYRYAKRHGLDTKIVSCSIPSNVRERCISLAKNMGLVVAGIDLRYNPDSDRWYCFEVNPSPAFTYYQDSTGQQIDKAIAQLLVKEDSR
jgi:glutathione synthase/RimK-type ligase-like ATP-grasp enzyme